MGGDAYLRSGDKFSDWIVSWTTDTKFKENQDFVNLASVNSEARWGGHNRTEYYLTVRMAKDTQARRWGGANLT